MLGIFNSWIESLGFIFLLMFVQYVPIVSPFLSNCAFVAIHVFSSSCLSICLICSLMSLVSSIIFSSSSILRFLISSFPFYWDYFFGSGNGFSLDFFLVVLEEYLGVFVLVSFISDLEILL